MSPVVRLGNRKHLRRRKWGASPFLLNPKIGIGTADYADHTDGKGFPIRAAEIISPRYFLSKLRLIRAIRVIRGSNFGVQVELELE